MPERERRGENGAWKEHLVLKVFLYALRVAIVRSHRRGVITMVCYCSAADTPTCVWMGDDEQDQLCGFVQKTLNLGYDRLVFESESECVQGSIPNSHMFPCSLPCGKGCCLWSETLRSSSYWGESRMPFPRIALLQAVPRGRCRICVAVGDCMLDAAKYVRLLSDLMYLMPHGQQTHIACVGHASARHNHRIQPHVCDGPTTRGCASKMSPVVAS